jgi:hypothetical protein
MVPGTDWLTAGESEHEANISFGYNGVARKP